MENLDLSGKILFKIKLDNEIKKIIIHNDDLNYNELVLMMQRIFSERIKQNEEFSIKYTDEENDLITMSNDSDVTLALQTSKILKLTIFLKETNEVSEEVKPSEIASELKHIRQSIDKFLVKFEKSLKLDEKIQNSEDLVQSASTLKLSNNQVHKEFDPLIKKELNDSAAQSKSYNIQKSSRTQTPDSIGSSEFTGRLSPGQKKFANNSNADLNMSQQYGQMNNQIPSQPQSIQQDHQQFTQNYNQHVQPSQVQQQPLPQPQAQVQQQQQQLPQNQFLQNPVSSLKTPGQQLQHPHQPQFLQQNMPNTQQLGLQQTNAPADLQAQQYYQQQQQQFYPQQNLANQQHPAQPNLQHPGMLNQQIPNQQHPSLQHPTGASQQQTQHPGQMHGQQQANQPQPTHGYPPSIQQNLGSNPYSKNPNISLVRPPSTTIYQQGYK